MRFHSPLKYGCQDSRQADYVGTMNITRGGLECARWDNVTLSEYMNTTYLNLKYVDADFVAAFVKNKDRLMDNYCRNFDGSGRDGAWCVTTNFGDELKWDYCDVPFCPSNCEAADKTKCGCENIGQNDYRGNLNVTNVGETCLDWSAPNGYYTPSQVEEMNVDGSLDGNYCRSPDYYGDGKF